MLGGDGCRKFSWKPFESKKDLAGEIDLITLTVPEIWLWLYQFALKFGIAIISQTAIAKKNVSQKPIKKVA